MYSRKISLITVALTLALLLITLLPGCGACVDDGKVRKAVEKQGYSDVKIKDKSVTAIGWRGCSDSDSAAYKMRAKNPKGQEVDIIVCAGWPFKGVTIRTK